MQCDRTRDLLGAYRDRELMPDERQAVASHLATCAACSDRLADDERIGRALRQHGRTSAPAGLAARVSAALDHSELRHPEQSRGPLSSPWSSTAARVARNAAALAAASVLSGLVTWWSLTSVNPSGRLLRDIVNAHVRSLLQETQVQVASSDQHTVRPWFAGRTDFAPEVRDLAAEGFPLVGGRLDYVDDRRVGVLVYKRRQHVINVFTWAAPNDAPSAARLESSNGYTLLSWHRNGIAYSAISDLNADEMRVLHRLL